MNNEKVSKAYAMALTQIAEKSGLDIVEELTRFNQLIGNSEQLEALMFLDVFTIEEKLNVLEGIFERTDFSAITHNFIKFLLMERRINVFPLVYKDLVIIDDDKKGFMRGIIEGVEELIDEDVKQRLENFLKKHTDKRIEFSYQQKKNLSAGYRVTVGDLQLDATLDKQLDKLKNDILNVKK